MVILCFQLERLQERLATTEHELSDRLQHLGQVQQAAIEYNRSADDDSFPSPSIPVQARAPDSPKHPLSPTKAKTSNIPKPSFSSPAVGNVGAVSEDDDGGKGARSKLSPPTRYSPIKTSAKAVKSCDNLGPSDSGESDVQKGWVQVEDIGPDDTHGENLPRNP